MNIEELIKMKKEGKKIPDDIWNSLSAEDKKKVLNSCKRSGGSRKPPRNPWEAYALTEQIARDIGSYPYNVVSGVGRNVSVSSKTGNNVSSGVVRPTEVSALVIEEDFVPGKSTSRSSGVNMASLQLYTAVRRKNSGAKVYEAPDLMMMVLAMTDIYAMILWARRVLKTVPLYHVMNHAIPDLILQCDGVLPDDLRANYAQYRGRLNLLIAKANAFAVPKYFKAFEIIDHRMSHLFADSSDIRGQLVVHEKRGYYQWSATEAGGSQLNYSTFRGIANEDDFSSYLNIIEGQLNAMFTDDDIQTMSGDILKEFGPENLYTIKEVGENEVVDIVFDEDHLAQVENMIFPNSTLMLSPSAMNIVQNSEQAIVFDPKKAGQLTGRANFLDSYIINSHKDAPDYRDNLEWTRMHTIPRLVDSSTVDFIFGLEFISQVLLVQYSYVGDATNEPALTSTEVVQVTSNVDEIVSVRVPQLEQVDWHPIRYHVRLNSVSGQTSLSVQSLAISGDLKHYTWLNVSIYESTDDAAVTALFWAHTHYKASAT